MKGKLLPSIFPVEQLEAQAIAFLRKHEPAEGWFVGFSGGKDSIVTEHLCKLAGVKYQAYYSCTRIDPPEIARFIQKYYPHVIWLYPKMTFWEGIRKKSPPLRVMRWCCDTLKKDPSKHIPLKHRVMGIRAEESLSRAGRPQISSFAKQIHYKPIFWWKEWHIWDFIEKHNLSYPSLYDEGFHRIGCVICPFLASSNMAAFNKHKERWPGLYRVFEKAVTDWYNNHSLKKERYSEKTAEEYLMAYYRGFINDRKEQEEKVKNTLF